MKFDVITHLQTLKDIQTLTEVKEYRGAKALMNKLINKTQKHVDEIKREERKRLSYDVPSGD